MQQQHGSRGSSLVGSACVLRPLIYLVMSLLTLVQASVRAECAGGWCRANCVRIQAFRQAGRLSGTRLATACTGAAVKLMTLTTFIQTDYRETDGMRRAAG